MEELHFLASLAKSFVNSKPTALSDLSHNNSDEVHLLREENKRLKKTLTEKLQQEFGMH
jgi:hypothetical protein